MSDQRLTRIAIVSADKCKPKKCRQECKKSCPVVKTEMRLRSGFKKLYVDVDTDTEEVPLTRLNFPSLVDGVRSWNKEAIRQFRELLLIEWSPPPPTELCIAVLGISEFLRKARFRKKSEAAHLLNEIVHCWRPSRRNTNDLVAVNCKQRARIVEMCSKEFTSLGLVLAGVWSDQSDLQLFATQKFRVVLFDTLCPVDAPFILEYGIVPRLYEFLERKNVPLLRIEAALALIDICDTALMYPNLWTDLDLVKILLKLLDFPSCDVRDKAVLRLGMLAESYKGRDLVHQHDALHPLLDKVLRPLLDELDETDKLLPKLRNVTYTLLRFCKGEEKPNGFVEEVTENKYGIFFAAKPVVVVSPHLDKMRLRSGFKKLYVDVDTDTEEVPLTRLNFPSLVDGVRSWNKEAIRQFRELLLIEWSPPPPTELCIAVLGISEFLRKARFRKKSEAAHLLNEIVHCWRPSRRNTNDLVAVNCKQRARIVEMCSKEFTSLGLVLAGVWSDQSDLQLFATQKFRVVLFDTLCPVDAPFILEYGIVPRLYEFLERKNVPLLRIEAALALIDICDTALMYPNLWTDLDLVKILLKLLDFPSCDVRDKAVLRLGMLAESYKGRDLVHQHDALHPLLDKVLRPLLDELDETDKLLPKLRNVTYTLLRFCKGEEKPNGFVEEVTENKYGIFFAAKPVVVVSPHLDKMRTIIPELSRLVGSTDEKVLTNTCWMLACFADSTHCKTRVIGDDVCQRLVELLEHQSPSVVTPAFRALRNIVLREDIQSQHIVDFGTLPCLWKLLSKNIEEMEVWMTIRTLTKRNNRWIKAAQTGITNSQFHDSVRQHEIEEKKKEVNEKLNEYDEDKLEVFCIDLRISFYTIRITKEDMVSKLMDYLEGLHTTTSELYAEEEQSSKGKKRRRESELEKDANEETANGVPKRSVEQMSEPSDDELCGAIGDILREVDFRTVDIIDIMERLGKRFGRDMTPKETHIRIMMEFQITQVDYWRKF